MFPSNENYKEIKYCLLYLLIIILNYYTYKTLKHLRHYFFMPYPQ